MEKQDQTQESDDIQDDIHRTRERIDETLEAIKEQLSPGELMKQLFGYFRQGKDGGGMHVREKAREKAGEALSSVARAVKENPIPAALIGIGLLGMVKSDRKPNGREHMKTGEKARELAADAREKLEHGVEKMRDRVDDVRERVEDVRERVEDDPLVLAALGIALGAALGAGLPRTRVEDELFGEKRDELAAKAKQVGEQLREGVKHGMGEEGRAEF
jgi:hypothetical protein